MGYSMIAAAGLKRTPSLGSLTTTGANETARMAAPSGLTVALLQKQGLTSYLGPAEAWIWAGLSYVVTTTITVTAPVVTVANAGVAITGATITVPITAAATTILFAPCASYTRPTIATTDTYSGLVTTTSTAGVINPTYLWYVPIAYAGVSAANTNV